MISIRKKMDSEKQNFLLHLERLKTLYPQVQAFATDDAKQAYNNEQFKIDKSFENLYLIKNELLNKSDSLANNMINKDEYINTAKNINNERETQLNIARSKNYAALPREKNVKADLYNEILYAGIQSIFFAGSGYLIYKLLKS